MWEIKACGRSKVRKESNQKEKTEVRAGNISEPLAAPVYSAAGEFVLVQMKQRERRESCTSNRMRKGVRRGERKSLSLPTYIKQPHSGCQSAADILHKFQSFLLRRAQSRVSRSRSRAPDLLWGLSFERWGGFKKNKSQSSLHTGVIQDIQKSLCTRESLYFIELVIGKSLTGWSIACLAGMGSKKWF